MDNQEEKGGSEEKGNMESEAPKSGQKFKIGPKKTARIVGAVIAVLLIVMVVKSGGSTGASAVTVNGEKISQEDFDARVELVISSSQVEGIDTSDPGFRAQLEDSVINELINTVLLLQGAREAGISADPTEVDEQYQIIVDQFGSEAAVKDTLGENGVTVRELRQNIEEQIIINAFVDSQIEPDAVLATEEEIVALYDRDAALQDNMPPLEAVRSQLEAQVVAGKTQQIALALINQLREAAEIEFPSENE